MTLSVMVLTCVQCPSRHFLMGSSWAYSSLPKHMQFLETIKKPEKVQSNYPVVNKHSHGKSPFSMGNSTINCHVQ